MNNTTIALNIALPDVPFMLEIQALYHKLEALSDQRRPKGLRYSLAVLVMLALLAKFAGQNSIAQIAAWVKGHCPELVQLLALSRPTMPHPVTFSRVLGDKVDSTQVQSLISDYFKEHLSNQIPARGSITLSIDGKNVAGHHPKRA